MKRISEDIKNNEFQQFYLLMGEEGYLKKQYKEKIVKALIDAEDSMNYHYFEGNHPNLQNIYELGETLPFFSERRVLVLENTGLLKKSVEGIDVQFERFPDSTFVIMVESEVDKRNRLYKWFGQHGYVADMKMPDDKMLISWVKKLCKDEKKEIEDSAIFYLVEHMGMDMFLLKSELEKLFCYCHQKNCITIEDIREVCVDEAADKMYDMLDAIGNRNQKKALQLYHDLLVLRKPPMQILSLLTRHFNILMQISALKETGKDNKAMASICGIPPFSVRKYVGQANLYSFDNLKKMLEQCQMTDQEIKTGIIKDIVGVELLIVKFSGK